MRQLMRRLESLEAASAPLDRVTLDASTLDLCRFLARLPREHLHKSLAGFSAADKHELFALVRENLPEWNCEEVA